MNNGFLGLNFAKALAKGITGQINGSYTLPGTAYLAILSSKPSMDGSNVADLEPITGGYKREIIGHYNQSIVNCFGEPTVNEDGSVTINNAKQIKFDKASATWQDKNGNTTFSWYAVMSGQTGGSLIFAGELKAAITVGVNESVNLGVGEAPITIA